AAEELHQGLPAKGNGDVALLAPQRRRRFLTQLHLREFCRAPAAERAERAGLLAVIPDVLQQCCGEALVVGCIDQGAQMRALAYPRQGHRELSRPEADVVLTPENGDRHQVTLRLAVGEIDVHDRQEAALVSE